MISSRIFDCRCLDLWSSVALRRSKHAVPLDSPKYCLSVLKNTLLEPLAPQLLIELANIIDLIRIPHRIRTSPFHTVSRLDTPIHSLLASSSWIRICRQRQNSLPNLLRPDIHGQKPCERLCNSPSNLEPQWEIRIIETFMHHQARKNMRTGKLARVFRDQIFEKHSFHDDGMCTAVCE